MFNLRNHDKNKIIKLKKKEEKIAVRERETIIKTTKN